MYAVSGLPQCAPQLLLSAGQSAFCCCAHLPVRQFQRQTLLQQLRPLPPTELDLRRLLSVPVQSVSDRCINMLCRVAGDNKCFKQQEVMCAYLLQFLVLGFVLS